MLSIPVRELQFVFIATMLTIPFSFPGIARANDTRAETYDANFVCAGHESVVAVQGSVEKIKGAEVNRNDLSEATHCSLVLSHPIGTSSIAEEITLLRNVLQNILNVQKAIRCSSSDEIGAYCMAYGNRR